MCHTGWAWSVFKPSYHTFASSAAGRSALGLLAPFFLTMAHTALGAVKTSTSAMKNVPLE